MQSISFTIPGDPVPKKEKVFNRKTGHSYMPRKSAEGYAFYRAAIADQLPDDWVVMEGPLIVEIWAYVTRPKSKRFKNVFKAVARLENEEQQTRFLNKFYPTTRPDSSNYLKLIEDAMIGIVFRDDSQGVDTHVFKRYTNGMPCTCIKVKQKTVLDFSVPERHRFMI